MECYPLSNGKEKRTLYALMDEKSSSTHFLSIHTVTYFSNNPLFLTTIRKCNEYRVNDFLNTKECAHLLVMQNVSSVATTRFPADLGGVSCRTQNPFLTENPLQLAHATKQYPLNGNPFKAKITQ